MDLLDGKFFRDEFARLHERLDALERKLDQRTLPAPSTEESNNLIRHLLAGGYKLQAIKAYQEATGADLAAAEAYIERLSSQLSAAKRNNHP